MSTRTSNRRTAQPRLPQTESQGFVAASRGRSGLRTAQTDQGWIDFERLTTDEARAAFADHWLSLNSEALERTWKMSYELLRVVRDTKLYERPMPDRQLTFDSFEDYFGHYFERGLEAWVELENTYRFAHSYAPRLFGKRYTAARSAARIAEVRAAAEAEQVALATSPHGGDRKSESVIKSDNITLDRQGGTSREQALRRLRAARQADLYERVLAGELSPHAAMLQAGLRKPTWTAPQDPTRLITALRRHYSAAELKLIAQAIAEEILL